jgi:hypothetical protein
VNNPLLDGHRQELRRLYDAEALPMLHAIARTGVTAEDAAEAVTYAFEQLAKRPDLTGRGVSPIAWLTSVARNHAQRLQLAHAAPAPAPTKAQAPDLLAALGRTPGSRRRRRPTTAPATTKDRA